MANTNQNGTNQANTDNSGTQNLDSLQSNPYINGTSQSNANQSGFSNAPQSTAFGTQNQQTQNGFGNAFGSNQSTQNNAQANTTSALSSFFNSGNSQQDFLKGAFIGAVATFILTNKDAQKAIFKGFAKISSLFEMGIEELKERYEDAKAEVDSN